MYRTLLTKQHLTSAKIFFTMSCGEKECVPQPSEPAERKANRLKRKDLRSACVNKSQVFVCYSVPIGFPLIMRYTTIPIWTCVEWEQSAPVDYGQLILLTAKYLVTLVIIIKRTITLSTANAIRKEYGNHTPIIL